MTGDEIDTDAHGCAEGAGDEHTAALKTMGWCPYCGEEAK